MPPHQNGHAGFGALTVIGDEPCWPLAGDSTTTINYATNEDANHITLSRTFSSWVNLFERKKNHGV